MSFGKAPIKRFNDKTGCAPPVGQYDPNDGKKVHGTYIEKSDRFKQPKDVGPGPATDESIFSFSRPSAGWSSTPIKSGSSSRRASANSSTCSESSDRGVGTIKPKKSDLDQQLIKIKGLELELRKLKEEHRRVKQHLEQTEKQLAETEAQLQKVQQEHAASEQEFKDQAERITQTQKQLEELQDLQNTSQLALQQKEQQLANMQKELQRLQQDASVSQTTLQEKERQLADCQEKLQELQQDHSVSQAVLQQKELQLAEAQKEQQMLQEQLQQKEWQYGEIREQLHEVQVDMQWKVQQLQETAEQVQEVQQELQEKEQLYTEARDQILVLQQEMQQKEQLHTEAVKQLQTLQEDVQQKEHELAEARSEQQKLQLEVQHKERQHAEVEKELQVVREKLQQAETEAAGHVQELQQTLQQKQQQHVETEEHLLDLQQILRQKEQEQSDAADKLQLLQHELGQKQIQCEELRQELVLKESGLEQVVSGAKSMKQLLFEESAEKASLQEQVEQLDQDNKLLETNIRSLTEKFTELEKELGAQRSVSQHLELQVQVAEKSCQDKNGELERTQLMNRDLIQSLGEFEDELSRMRNQEQASRTQLETTKAELTSVGKMNAALHTQLEEVKRSAHDAETKVQTMAVEIKQHHIANSVLKAQITSLTESASKEREHFKEKLKSANQERHKLQEKYREDLQNVKKALALDRQNADAQMSELSLRLERNQTLNSQMKEETKKLLADKERLQHQSRLEITRLQELVKTMEATSQTKLSAADTQAETLQKQLADAEKEKVTLQEGVEALRQSLTISEEAAQCQEALVQACQLKLSSLEDQVHSLEAEREAMTDELNRMSDEHSTLQEAALEERAEFERITGEMSEKIQQLEDAQVNRQETEEWKTKYEDLLERVGPFMDQLDAFATERDLLLGRSEMAEAEMAKTMEKYAKLLGHQNHRQKIQYINKMKDDFMKCRKEKEELKEKVNKQHTTIQKLEKRVNMLEGKRTFDPAQAFKIPRKVEPPRSPLKDANK